MLIKSKIHRNPGTFVTMKDGTRYAFMPNDAGDHVAEVNDPKHIERLLSITEGFGIYSDDVIADSVVTEALAAKQDDPPPDKTDQTTDQTGEGGEQPPAQEDQVKVDGEGEGQGGEPAPSAPPADPVDMPLEHMTLTDLQATYEREMGKKPHHRAGSEKLIEDITTHRAAQG